MRDPTRIGQELRSWMRRKGVTEAGLARRLARKNKQIMISQSWISRIANGHFRRLTPKVRHVTDYANIRVEDAGGRERGAEVIIKSALDEVWDGSAAHAVFIARLIRATRGMTR